MQTPPLISAAALLPEAEGRIKELHTDEGMYQTLLKTFVFSGVELK